MLEQQEVSEGVSPGSWLNFSQVELNHLFNPRPISSLFLNCWLLVAFVFSNSTNMVAHIVVLHKLSVEM